MYHPPQNGPINKKMAHARKAILYELKLRMFLQYFDMLQLFGKIV